MPELPPILQGEALQQIAQLRDYLVRRERGRENEILQTVSAEGDGIVLYFTPGLSARPGWPLVAYGLSEKLTE